MRLVDAVFSLFHIQNNSIVRHILDQPSNVFIHCYDFVCMASDQSRDWVDEAGGAAAGDGGRSSRGRVRRSRRHRVRRWRHASDAGRATQPVRGKTSHSRTPKQTHHFDTRSVLYQYRTLVKNEIMKTFKSAQNSGNRARKCIWHCLSSSIFHSPKGWWIMSETCAEINPSLTRNNAICIYSGTITIQCWRTCATLLEERVPRSTLKGNSERFIFGTRKGTSKNPMTIEVPLIPHEVP